MGQQGYWVIGRPGGIRLCLARSTALVTAALAVLLRLAGRGRSDTWSAAAGALAPIATLAVHETGHALVARRIGTPTEAIVLTPFAGATVLAEPPATPAAEGAFFAGGVAGNLLLAGLSSALLRLTPRGSVGRMLEMLRLLNVGLATTNLLPIGPLDGGRLVQAARWRATGDRDLAARESVEIGRMVGGSLCGVGLAALAARRRFPGGLPIGIVGLGVALLLGGRLSRTPPSLP